MWKKRLAWGIFMLLSIGAITYYGGVISYSLFYACAAFPFICGVYLFYVYRRFTIFQSIDSRNIISGQAVPYSFTLHNDDITVYTGIEIRMFSNYFHIDNMDDNIKYRLFPGDRVRLDTKLTCKYRGEYNVGVKEIVVYDFFGFFCIRYPVPTSIRALVTPRIIVISEPRTILQLNSILEKESIHEKKEMDVVVRDYAYGDSIRKIHWKQTARTQSLKVRNEIGIRKQTMMILFSAQRISTEESNYLPVENKVLETVIALLYYFALQNTEIQLLWRDESLKKRDIMSIKYFDMAFQELSYISFHEKYDFLQTVGDVQRAGMMMDSTVLFFVTAKLEWELLTFLSSLANEGKIIIIYVITKEDISKQIAENGLRMHIFAIDPEQDLSGVL